MFRIYYAVSAGLVKADGIEIEAVEVPDPPSRELELSLIRGDVDLANIYLPNYLECRLDGAPIIGLCTEWKSTGKGNGMFVRRGEIASPKALEGRKIATHQGRHAIHSYLLKNSYGVKLDTLSWAASPQETLLGILQRKEADAVVLLDHFFYHGLQAQGIECLYTDGDAWRVHTGFDEMIKHIVAASEPMMKKNPSLQAALLQAFRDSFAYSERNMEEVADVFLTRYGGDKEALLASARYPRMTFTFTETEQKLALREMEMFVEIGRLPRMAPLETLFLF